MQKRTTRLEEFNAEHSYEEITNMETQFLLELYEAVLELKSTDSKVSLLNISKLVSVSPRELMDYLPEVTEMDRQLSIGSNE